MAKKTTKAPKKSKASSPSKSEDVSSWAAQLRPTSVGNLCFPESDGGSTMATLKGLVNKPPKAQTILLTGTSGSAKTTCARILADAISRGVKADVTEHNASERRGIDDIRALLTFGDYMPSDPKGSRVIIVDEIQALVGSGGNAALSALLGPMEDTKKRLVWILCTDQPHLLPQTILSRAWRIHMPTPDVGAVSKAVVRALNNLGTLSRSWKPEDVKGLATAIAEKSGSNIRNALHLAQSTDHALVGLKVASWKEAKKAGFPKLLTVAEEPIIKGAGEAINTLYASKGDSAKLKSLVADLMPRIGESPDPEGVILAFAEAAGNRAVSATLPAGERFFAGMVCRCAIDRLGKQRPGASFVEKRALMLAMCIDLVALAKDLKA